MIERFAAFMDNMTAFAWIKDAGGRYVYLNKMLRQLAEFWEEELEKANTCSEILSRRLLEAGEAELRRIARELHDEIGQSLTAAKLEIETAKKLTDPAALSLRLDDTLA